MPACPLRDEDDIRRRLAAYRHPPVDPYPEAALPGRPRPAAVLIPLFQHEGAWHTLFIHRAPHPHDPHSGQVAFPGGQQERTDPTLVATALRETEEELGLPPHAVRVLGTLPRHRTVSNFWITPVVGGIPWPLPLHPSQSEVVRFFVVPLAWLRDPAHRETRTRHLGPGLPPISTTFFQPYEGEVIWGATARIVLTLLKALGL
ncbi:MAG TPA: CoA pyrophosphatase [Chloroflexi bacterium]|nr:CoA pyrophosphatase [Chloroflexota bacterium]